MAVLALPVLVLNSNWVPIRITSVRRALTKMIHGTAKAVIAEDYSVYDFESWAELSAEKDKPFLTTGRSKLRAPDVIVELGYGDIPDKKLAFSRANIYKRDKDTCQYCGHRFPRSELSIDHVIPRSKGGQSTWTNCVLSCLPCNRRKADKTPSQAGLVLLKAPTKPNWSPRLVLSRVPNTPENWDRFVSAAYWNTELK